MKSFKSNRHVLLMTAFAFLLMDNLASAQVVLKSATHFKATGNLETFQWAPSSYADATHPNSFQYDISYYIPTTLDPSRPVKALIFMHGGGSSTLSREGASEAVQMYAPDLQKLADELGIVVVLPSSSGLNWEEHTVELLHELAKLMRTELNVDSNLIGLAGHSMGGMGITRAFSAVADEFAFIMPMASGMETRMYSPQQVEWAYNKVFNVPYIVLQGLNDSFEGFVPACKKQLEATTLLEKKYGVPSKLNMHFYDTDHNYQYPVFKQYVSEAFKNPRDLYQKRLFGTIRTQDRWMTENQILYREQDVPRYFWIEAVDPDTRNSKFEKINFLASIEGNSISLQIPTLPYYTHKLRIYLSSKMVNLKLPVTFKLNGKVIGKRDPAKAKAELKVYGDRDPAYLYEDTFDIALPAPTPNY